MPDTQNYMIFGYVLGIGIFCLLVLSIWWRYRNLAADEAALEQLEAQIKEDSAQTASSAKTGAIEAT